jgi:hypothetical protein
MGVIVDDEKAQFRKVDADSHRHPKQQETPAAPREQASQMPLTPG